MRRALLWLLGSVGLACITSVADGDPLKVMSAPNVLRVGTLENIFVECQDCGGHGPMVVTISAWNFPTKENRLKHTTVTLNEGNKFQAFGKLVIPPDSFDKDPRVKQFVYLRAEFPEYTMEKAVLVSFQSGYLFIQTDKNLYTPDDKVHYRIFGLTPGMKPIEETPIEVEFLTPQGTSIRLGSFSLTSGNYSGNEPLRDASTGPWEIVARFLSSPQQSYSAKFEVKKYVLPSFEVKVTSNSPFYYYDAESFTISVEATYLFGKEVTGMAFVVFGVIIDNHKRVFPASLRRLAVTDGNCEATLQKADILRTFSNTEDLVGKLLFVSATVYTESGSEMVVGELRNIQIVTSPYVMNFDKTPKYFIPRKLFTVTVTINHPDGTPADGVPVVITSPGLNKQHGTTGENGRASVTITLGESVSSLNITATTNVNNLPIKRQASRSMVAQPYQSNTQKFIHLSMMTSLVKLSGTIRIDISFSDRTSFDITYLILSRGQLVFHGRQSAEGQEVIALNIPVTKEMLPSFRLIAYYHPTPGEVVSDSVWVDVGNACMGKLEVELKKPANLHMPREEISLKITGYPGAFVGMVAVDKGVHVLSKKHLLSQEKVWEIVEKADTGCTPGGGANSMGVFFDAGLMFQTDTADGTTERQEVKCPHPPARQRRAGTLLDVITTLASRYKDPLEQECCRDGMKYTPLSYTCAQRKLYITDGKACEDAFLFCCEELAKQRSELKQNSLILARSEEQVDYLDKNKITSRTQFPESWLWQTFQIPKCDGKLNCDVNTLTTGKIALKDSITTWVLTGISISENNSICVGNPLNVVVFRSFFIDLKLPYSAVVGEQIEIRAILHNYINTVNPITVRIDLDENTDVCSAASKRSKYTQFIKIGPSTTHTVPFLIIPMKKGELEIKVRAIVRNWDQGDEVTKRLRVVPQGVLTNVTRVFNLDPKDGTTTFNNPIPRSEMFPNSETNTKVFVTGRDTVSPLVENVLGNAAMGGLIHQPGGCGEQNMYHTSLTVIATTYLDKTKQWDTVGVGRRPEALINIQNGVEHQKKYRKSDGSFSVFTKRPSSVWLTAYVAKIFSMARRLTGVETSLICDAVKFLILNGQLPDGMFQQTGYIYDPTMTGGVLQDSENDASMTAFCLIAMQESLQTCNNVDSLPDAIGKSVAYLERRLPSLTNPYAVAITSYALANANKLNKRILFQFSTGNTHWRSPSGNMFTLEATAYALLALVKAKSLEEARPIVKWLSTRQKGGGGYGSTQATVIVYQALSEYWSEAKEPNYNLNVRMNVPGRAAPFIYAINQGNQHVARTPHVKITDANAAFTVTAAGTGEARLTIITQYYAKPQDDVTDCVKFNLSVDFSKDSVDADGDIYKLRMNFFFKTKTVDASMSILDISIPTGFSPIDEDLNALSEGHAAVISKWEKNMALSERGSIILYLDKVSGSREEELAFRMREKMKVGALQPASVSIYEYYDETKCVKYYHPQKKGAEMVRRCKGDVCFCAEANCSMQKKGNLSNRERKKTACQSDKTARIDFVYRGILENVQHEPSIDTYAMQIESVLKEGSDTGVQGQIRNFISLSHCRLSLNLKENKTYLIMGTAEDTISFQQSLEYMLGERTWIEYWPSEEECQTDQYESTCLGLENLVDTLERYACPQ